MTLLWRKFLECSSSPCSLRHPCDLTHSYGGRFWSVLPHLAHFVIPVISLTSSSLWSHSYGGSIWSVLPHTTHFVIPVFSHPWLVFSPISSLSLTSLSSHLTQVIPDYSLPSLVLPLIPYSVFSHTPTVIALTQVISHSHSHHLCYHAHSSPPVLTSLLLPLTHTECSHTECSHTHRHPWLLTHTTRLTLTHSSPRSLSPHFSECSHPSLVFSHSPSHIECHHTHSHILLTCVTTLSDLTSLVFWESVCSHFHGVVLPPSLLSHCLLSHTLSHPCHPCEHSHGVVLPPSLLTHCSERTCAPTHTPMVSYYHQVITHPHQSLCSHSLPCPHTLCSPHFISPHSHHQLIPTHLPHSPTHHASIASSSSHHLFLSPITTNRFLSLHTTLLTPPFHSQPSQSSPKSSPISIHTHNDNSRTP